MLDLVKQLVSSDQPTATAHEQAEALRERRRELQEELREAEDRLEKLQAELTASVAAGDQSEEEAGQDERIRLRERVEDLKRTEQRIADELEALRPALLRERRASAAERYRNHFEAARDELQHLEENLAPVLTAVRLHEEHYDAAVEAARELHELEGELEDLGEQAENLVKTANTDDRVLQGMPLYVIVAYQKLRQYWGDPRISKAGEERPR